MERYNPLRREKICHEELGKDLEIGEEISSFKDKGWKDTLLVTKGEGLHHGVKKMCWGYQCRTLK